MRLKQHKKTMLVFLLILAMMLSAGVFNVHAESNAFRETEPLSAQENQKTDLQKKDSVTSPPGEDPQVTVEDISSDTEETDREDETAMPELEKMIKMTKRRHWIEKRMIGMTKRHRRIQEKRIKRMKLMF